MPRLGLLNMALGFMVLFFAACAGAFVAFDLTEAYLRNLDQLHSWRNVLLSSAHGHTNLFGILHILLGLTLAYSRLGSKWKLMQTIGLFAGVVAMGPLMMVRSAAGPSESYEGIGFVIGLFLSLALLSLASHAAALFYRLAKAS